MTNSLEQADALVAPVTVPVLLPIGQAVQRAVDSRKMVRVALE
jgi:hypothetical protein